MSKYDWEKILAKFPDIRYVAKDRDGYLWGYYERPECDMQLNGWKVPSVGSRRAEQMGYLGDIVKDWYASLEECPYLQLKE